MPIREKHVEMMEFITNIIMFETMRDYARLHARYGLTTLRKGLSCLTLS